MHVKIMSSCLGIYYNVFFMFNCVSYVPTVCFFSLDDCDCVCLAIVVCT